MSPKLQCEGLHKKSWYQIGKTSIDSVLLFVSLGSFGPSRRACNVRKPCDLPSGCRAMSGCVICS